MMQYCNNYKLLIFIDTIANEWHINLLLMNINIFYIEITIAVGQTQRPHFSMQG